MTDIVHFQGTEFIKWLKVQLEKREYMCSRKTNQDAMKETLYEILFHENNVEK